MTETPDAAATKTLTTPRGMTRLVLLTYLVQTTALFATEPHEALFAAMKYPSAKDCQTCHPKHYEEWSVSPHAYALISPVFSSLRGTIVKKTNGTSGDFYIRCHTPAGMNLG